jgi:hypothetical protein
MDTNDNARRTDNDRAGSGFVGKNEDTYDSTRTSSGANNAGGAGYQSRGDAATSTGYAGGGGSYGTDDRGVADNNDRRTGGGVGEGGLTGRDADSSSGANRLDEGNTRSGGNTTGTSTGQVGGDSGRRATGGNTSSRTLNGKLENSSFGGENTTTQTFEKSQGHNFNDGFTGRTSSVIDKDFADQARKNVDSSSSAGTGGQRDHAGNLDNAGSSSQGRHGGHLGQRVEGESSR